MKNYVITIARGYGSGGKEIGVKLAQKLGIPCYDNEILDIASESSGINKVLFETNDEKLTSSYWLKKLVSTPMYYTASPQKKSFTSDDNLYSIQRDIIKTLGRTRSCVIIGKCADYILEDQKNVVNVFITSTREECIKSIKSKMLVSDKEANDLIEKTDKYRTDYYKYYTHGRKWTDPLNYDLTINTAKTGRDHGVEVIYDYLITKFGPDFNE